MNYPPGSFKLNSTCAAYYLAMAMARGSSPVGNGELGSAVRTPVLGACDATGEQKGCKHAAG